MGLITIDDLAHVVEGLLEGKVINPITVRPNVARAARVALDRMLEVSA